jgi:hypothetical protein
MMKLDFFTPISFANQAKSYTQSLLETADNYFYLGGKKAYVIPGDRTTTSQGVVVLTESQRLLTTALKAASYVTLVLPAIMISIKFILRSTHSFHVMNVRQEIERGVDIKEETIEKINTLFPKLIAQQKDEGIQWHTKQVFSLVSDPQHIFKLDPTERRFQNMVEAKKISLAHDLNLLKIPSARELYIQGRALIAEECLDIQQEASKQEELYAKLSGMEETVRQLAIFIAKTGFSDVEWRNIPIVDDAPGFLGSRRVALIDLEEMGERGSPNTGIFGKGQIRRGLIRCLSSEQQIDIALAEAYRFGITSLHANRIKAQRLEELETYQRLNAFYQNKGILKDPRQAIEVDLSALGLNLEETAQIYAGQKKPTTQSLRAACVYVIAKINELIKTAPADKSIKGQRKILLNTNSDNVISSYSQVPVTPFLCQNKEEENQIWLRQIINALVAKGYLFKLERADGYGYLIQA